MSGYLGFHLKLIHFVLIASLTGHPHQTRGDAAAADLHFSGRATKAEVVQSKGEEEGLIFWAANSIARLIPLLLFLADDVDDAGRRSGP